MLEYLMVIVAGAILVLAAMVWRRRRPADGPDTGAVAARLDQLASAAHAQQQELAVLLEASRAQQQIAGGIQESLAQQRAQVGEVKASVAAAAAGLTEVKQAQGERHAALAEQVQQARQELARILAEGDQRAARADVAYASMGRLEAIIAGTKSRGTAGENLLAEVIKQLPPEFRDYDVRIGGKTVEFAVPLPDGRYLPVDSKWTSVDKLARLADASPEERVELVASIQDDVEGKVDEVAKYLDPEKTCGMAVLAVPDAIFDLCATAHVKAHKRGVVIVGYSMAVPYVLTTLQVIKRYGARVDEARISQVVTTVAGCLDGMSEELEGRLSRAITSLENSRRDLRTHVGKAQQALGRVQVQEQASHGNGHVEVEA
ncbi:MAG TPA: DNA recombination protein RmuC [Candidatus Thermoplasmatota archaeon]|nr:DNA recombination protein RmuC [Candidatus Thermoplasmatota archaeon]